MHGVEQITARHVWPPWFAPDHKFSTRWFSTITMIKLNMLSTLLTTNASEHFVGTAIKHTFNGIRYNRVKRQPLPAIELRSLGSLTNPAVITYVVSS